MCGIVGATSSRNVVPVLIDGVRRLEYRGYDSTGLAVLRNVNGTVAAGLELSRLVTTSRVADLASAGGSVGPRRHHRHRPHPLGDPRRADAGQRASACLAGRDRGRAQRHHREFREPARADLSGEGYVFATQTDTEVIAHLVHAH